MYLLFHKTKIFDLYIFKIHKLERYLDCYRGSNFRFKHLTWHKNTGFNQKRARHFYTEHGSSPVPLLPSPLDLTVSMEICLSISAFSKRLFSCSR